MLNERQAGREDYEGDLGEQAFQPAGEPELPDVPAVEEELDYSPDYEPGEAVQAGAGAWSDNEVERGVELELREGVEPSSLVEFPEDEEAMMEVEPEVLDRVPREDAEGMMMSIEHREALSCAAVSPKEEIVELGGEKLVVEMPYSSVDDTNGGVLDVGLTYEGMLRELRALESLAVGDVIWEVDPREKVISTRWVSNAKTERVDGRENHLVRCRVVARDFAQGATAAQLGISSATSSAEALRTFICYAGSKKRNIVGLDVSTAFLFADLDPDGRVVVKLPDGVKGRDGRRGFLRLKKALCGLRIAAQQWSRHLAKLLKKLCSLEACETEPCLFSGTVCGGQRVVVLCYVDDLLVTGDSDEAIYYVVEKLKEAVKLKVTADLDRDGMITFLGRQIYRNPGDESLYFGMSNAYFEEIFEGFGCKNVVGNPTPPDLRSLYDREEERLDVKLSLEAASRYRSTLGRLSWLAMTRVDLVYYVSMLARGQADPRERHERAMRAVLRYLKYVQSFQQVVRPMEEWELVLDCYVDASWGSEKNVDRKSISGGCVMLGSFCLKAWSRLQQAVALSSAEFELYGLVEGAKEVLALRRAVARVFGWEEPLVPRMFCDSEAALAISKADGLRKVRHIDIRACFIQDQLRQKQLFAYGVRGEWHMADIFTKTLDAKTTLKHMSSLGLRDVGMVACLVGLGGFKELFMIALVGKQHMSLLERYQLLPFKKWLVVEFCAPVRSNMQIASEGCAWVGVITVSELDDGSSPATVENVRLVAKRHLARGGLIFLWSSTPCTGGSPWQHLLVASRGDDYRRGRLARHWALHRKLWKSFTILSTYVHGWAIEWPKRCAYWGWNQTRKFLSSRNYPLYDFTLDGCELGMRGRDGLLVFKRWRVVTTHSKVKENLVVFECSKTHERSKNFNLRDTQHYPEGMMQAFFGALQG